MAQKSSKFSDNLEGKYYVDDQCIACNACLVEAPDFFQMNEDEGHAFVKKQPSNAAESSECEKAVAICPVNAIGNDG